MTSRTATYVWDPGQNGNAGPLLKKIIKLLREPVQRLNQVGWVCWGGGGGALQASGPVDHTPKKPTLLLGQRVCHFLSFPPALLSGHTEFLSIF